MTLRSARGMLAFARYKKGARKLRVHAAPWSTQRRSRVQVCLGQSGVFNPELVNILLLCLGFNWKKEVTFLPSSLVYRKDQKPRRYVSQGTVTSVSGSCHRGDAALAPPPVP